ncbi:hypothetical protein E1A91_D12G157800v1 [Gossypium mustelinum]|uniref:Proline-tRNA ligase class II C-terminal domain-containing protein n=2 Tax=Gossypium mustelinum TaxID=34275 RepID=A0A5D2SEN6_GOSMU|nr:hypothetical protein E1A91_D12G157800v1 [Gossypium mustelinum]
MYSSISLRPLFLILVHAVRRDNGEKTDISRVFLVEQVKGMLDKIQENLYDVAKQKRDACIEVVKTWDEFVKALGQKKLILAPWCDEEEVEKDVKARTRGEMGAAKSLFVPHSNSLNSQKVRHRLRKDHGIEGGIPIVFSLEKPKAQLLPFRGPSGEEDNPSNYQWGNSSNILKQNLK